MDAITLLIEAVGVVILMMWIVIPIREFREILKRIKSRDAGAVIEARSASSSGRGPHA